MYLSLSINTKLALYISSLRSVKTYACPNWEYATDAHLLKLQRMQNKVLRAAENLDGFTSVRELHVTSKIPYLHDK